ncbi:sensor histidine kinase [Fodinicola feengrottensis]|uniref:sensor histidine kinase n=1 Tax=Fodinicola feengrottensis TaxID=435914 RepID=UPI0031D13BD6
MQLPAPTRARTATRRREIRMLVLDAITAIAAVILLAYATLEPPGLDESPKPVLVCWLAALVVGLPIAVRRLSPRVVLCFVLCAGSLVTATAVVSEGVVFIAYVPTALALYLVALRSPRIWSFAVLPICIFATAMMIFLFYSRAVEPQQRSDGFGEIAGIWLMLAVAWGLGTLIRWRRFLADRIVQERARDAVVDERLRIARELHDIVGHSMSLIAVKATVANHLADVRPEETRAALAIIEETSRNALGEIRKVLGILRSDTGSGAELVPVVGLSDVRELADRAESAGVEVDLVVRSVGPLPVAMELSIYRIVQEGLTNVISHAAPTHCRVDVDADELGVRIEVTDDGPRQPRTPARTSGGHGLIGINERVTMFGGTFAAGPRGEGGFRLSAHLPYEAS